MQRMSLRYDRKTERMSIACVSQCSAMLIIDSFTFERNTNLHSRTRTPGACMCACVCALAKTVLTERLDNDESAIRAIKLIDRLIDSKLRNKRNWMIRHGKRWNQCELNWASFCYRTKIDAERFRVIECKCPSIWKHIFGVFSSPSGGALVCACFSKGFLMSIKLKCMQRLPRFFTLFGDTRIRFDWPVFFFCHNSIMTHDCIWHLTMFTWNDFFKCSVRFFSLHLSLYRIKSVQTLVMKHRNSIQVSDISHDSVEFFVVCRERNRYMFMIPDRFFNAFASRARALGRACECIWHLKYFHDGII